MFRRLLITAVSTMVFGWALVSCGDGAGSGEPLRWRTAVDIPVNFTMKVGNNLNYAKLLPDDIVDCDSLEVNYPEWFSQWFSQKPCEEYTIEERLDLIAQLPRDPDNPTPEPPDSGYIFDIGSGSVPTTSDVIDVLRTLTDTKIQYSITAANNTNVSLTFYGMLFTAADTAAMKDSVDVFYDTIINSATREGRVNMFGTEGLFLRSKKTGSYPSKGLSSEEDGRLLGDLIIRQKKFSYRWLVKIDDISGLTDTSSTKESVDIKLRIRFSGVNSVDSLFTL